MNCLHIAVVLFSKVIYHRGQGQPFKTVIGFGKGSSPVSLPRNQESWFHRCGCWTHKEGVSIPLYGDRRCGHFPCSVGRARPAWPHHTVMNVSLRTAFLKIFMWTETSPMSSCSEGIRHKVWGGSQKSCRCLGAGRWQHLDPSFIYKDSGPWIIILS